MTSSSVIAASVFFYSFPVVSLFVEFLFCSNFSSLQYKLELDEILEIYCFILATLKINKNPFLKRLLNVYILCSYLKGIEDRSKAGKMHFLDFCPHHFKSM